MLVRTTIAISAMLAVYVSGVAHEPEIDFAHEIVPILKTHCVGCHGGSEAKGGFSLNSRTSFLESDAAVVGDSSESHFLQLIDSGDADSQMPPKDRPRVPAKDRSTLARWVDAGMPWTDGFSFAENTYQPPLLPREVILPGKDENKNPIDRILAEYFRQHDLAPPEPADDITFVRRASLDLIGLLPSMKLGRDFTTSQSASKRAELIDQLLAHDMAYAEHWLTFWNDLLRNDYDGTGFITGGRKQISSWLYQSLINNKPFDQFARELVSPPSAESRGFIEGIKWRGTVSAGQTIEIQFAQSVAQSFLGINLKCASCHDSFIDRWKLTDAYSLAAVYASEPLHVHRCDKPTGQRATAAWLFPELGQIDPDAPQSQRLEQLAGLMTSPRNGRFARTIVNRLWAQLMGRGIVHPLDAMHRRPWNEDLLDYLANYLVDQKYDLKAVIRLIASSDAYGWRSDYQRGDRPAEYRFRGRRAKRMTAEQFVDAVWQITGAAPTNFDAPVIRGKSTNQAGETISLTGTWIWGDSAKDGKVPPGNEQLVFRKSIELPAEVKTGAAVITADNGFELYVLRRQVAAGNDWTRPQTVALHGLLKKGKNDFVVVARNFTDRPNPAGLYFEAHLVLVDGSSVVIATGPDWQVSQAAPAGGREGRLGRTPGPWQPATDLGWPAHYDSVRAHSQGALRLARTGVSAMVRASLLKSDFLMRSLGRPNRDQIVASRPSELTTLEAIDLSNGKSLAKALSVGARNWTAGEQRSTKKLVDELFRLALARPPTDQELNTLASELGADPSPQQIEDLMWAVVMMPEFVMIR